MYIYNRKGKCLYYQEWERPLNTLSDDPDEEKKLVYVEYVLEYQSSLYVVDLECSFL